MGEHSLHSYRRTGCSCVCAVKAVAILEPELRLCDTVASAEVAIEGPAYHRRALPNPPMEQYCGTSADVAADLPDMQRST
eukprot:1087056-Amphidinium_carterae.1